MSNLPQTTDPVIAKKQEAWSKFAVALHNREAQLQLMAQKIVAKMVTPKTIDDIAEAEKTLKTAKTDLAILIESRKEVTSKLDAVTTRLMEPEKSLTEPIAIYTAKIIEIKK